MSDEQVLILAGIGGQGIQVTAKTLARAAVYDRRRALYFSLFDGAQRGGVSDGAVAISTGAAIQAPPLMKQPCDALLAMDPNGLKRYEMMIRPGSPLIYNRSIHEVSRFRYADMHKEEVVDDASPSRSDVDILEIPATHIATEQWGTPLMATLVCLGALIGKTDVVTLPSALQALRASIRPGRQHLLEPSEAAITLGAKLGRGEISIESLEGAGAGAV